MMLGNQCLCSCCQASEGAATDCKVQATVGLHAREQGQFLADMTCNTKAVPPSLPVHCRRHLSHGCPEPHGTAGSHLCHGGLIQTVLQEVTFPMAPYLEQH